MRFSAWVFALTLGISAIAFAAAKDSEPPDREMLKMMELLREMEMIKQMDMLRDMQHLENSDQVKNSAAQKSAPKKETPK
jgi:hypothetical protein